MDFQQQQVIFQEIADAIKFVKFGADSVSSRITPLNMTTNTVPSPYVVSQSSVWDNQASRRGWNAFAANIGNNGWLAAPWGSVTGSTCTEHRTTGNDWLQIKLDKSYIANKVTLYTRRVNYTQIPRDFTLSGSNDGTSWTILLDIADNPLDDRESSGQSWQFVNSQPFQYYRITITRVYEVRNLDMGCRVGLGRVELFSSSARISPHDFAKELAEIATASSAAFVVPNTTGQSLRARFKKTADVIRAKLGISTTMKPSQMPDFIRQIQPL